MHPVVKKILDSTTTNQKKLEEINDIKDSVSIAERIFSGEFTYCKNCGDYFLSGSFIETTEIVEEPVCVYSDPINSSGDIYEKKLVRYTYKYCPKGCKHKVKREEYW